MENTTYEVQRTNLVFEDSDVKAALQCLSALANSEVPAKEANLKKSLELAIAVLEGFLANEGFNTKRPRPDRPFAISEAQRNRIQVSDRPVGVTTLAARISKVLPYDMQRVGYTYISNWLTEIGALAFEEVPDAGRRRFPTEAGEELGLKTSTGTEANGNKYKKTVFTRKAQEFVIDNLEAIMAKHIAKEAPEHAGLQPEI